MLAGDYTTDLLVDDIKVNAWYQFPWLAWTEPEELASAVTDLFQGYQVNIFAPSHGNVIRKDATHYVDQLAEGMRQASDMAVKR